MGRVFANGLEDKDSIPGRVRQKKEKKRYLIPPCLTLSIIRYGSRVSGGNLEKSGALLYTLV